MTAIYPNPSVVFASIEDLHFDDEVTLVTNQPVFAALGAKCQFSIGSLLFVDQAQQNLWDALDNDLANGEIVTLGGGLAADAGKYLASRASRQVTVIPTALSVDAFMAWSSAVRKDGCVRYLTTTVADRLVIDLETISRAPAWIRAAGVCDLLSIAVGCADWQLAQKTGRLGPHEAFEPWAVALAQEILQATLDCASLAGAGDLGALRELLGCLLLSTQLLNILGHARPEEGSEHYFAYAVENLVGSGFPHAELVCPGILIMADLHGLEWLPLKEAILTAGVRLNRLDSGMIRRTLQDLPAYCQKHALPFGIAHQLTPEEILRLDLANIFS